MASGAAQPESSRATSKSPTADFLISDFFVFFLQRYFFFWLYRGFTSAELSSFDTSSHMDSFTVLHRGVFELIASPLHGLYENSYQDDRPFEHVLVVSGNTQQVEPVIDETQNEDADNGSQHSSVAT